MNETTSSEDMNAKVTYVGHSRDHLRGQVGIVKSINQKYGNTTFGVELPDGSIEYAAAWAWEILPKENISDTAKTFDLDDLFTGAAGGKLEVAENEIKRLEARIVELKKFVEVYKSL